MEQKCPKKETWTPSVFSRYLFARAAPCLNIFPASLNKITLSSSQAVFEHLKYVKILQS